MFSLEREFENERVNMMYAEKKSNDSNSCVADSATNCFCDLALRKKNKKPGKQNAYSIIDFSQ